MALAGTAEPQRLIAVSLGKIASSRSQRGGINLHKNLLVASVLHKARTAYMMENFQQMLAAKRAQNEQNITPQPVMDKNGGNTHGITTHHEAHGTRSTTNSFSRIIGESPDKENMPPVDTHNVGKVDCSHENVSTTKSDNVLKPNECSMTNATNSDYVSSSNDSLCLLKRRRSNPTHDSDTVLAKKAKYSDSLDSESQSEPMQTEPTQITNLVSIFNTGFGGLCSGSDNGDMQMGFSRSDSLSCSSQVDNRVGVSPIIALTV